MKVNERKLEILGAIVEIHVETSEPVGSLSVCKYLDLGFSAATIRSEMAELSLMGLLIQPHVSAGRIPSHLGYRTYIDCIMKECDLSVYDKSVIDEMIENKDYDPEKVIKSAAKILAHITGCAVITTAPWGVGAYVYDIKFVKISTNCVMIILLTTTGMVKNRLFSCGFKITDEIINILTKIGKSFVGQPLENLSAESLTMLSVKTQVEDFVVPALNAIIDVSKEASITQISIEGECNLFEKSGFSPDDALKIWEFLNKKNDLLEFLFSKKNVCGIFIGEETGIHVLSNACIIKKNYFIGQRKGVIALTGCVNINYSSIIAKLKYVCKTIEKILNEILSR